MLVGASRDDPSDGRLPPKFPVGWVILESAGPAEGNWVADGALRSNPPGMPGNIGNPSWGPGMGKDMPGRRFWGFWVSEEVGYREGSVEFSGLEALVYLLIKIIA